MDIVDFIRNASSAPQVLSALSTYAESLRHIPSVPDWCLQPLQGEADVRERMAVLFAVVNVASQNLRDGECNAAKRALRVFAEALDRLRRVGRAAKLKRPG